MVNGDTFKGTENAFIGQDTILGEIRKTDVRRFCKNHKQSSLCIYFNYCSYYKSVKMFRQKIVLPLDFSGMRGYYYANFKSILNK